MREERKSNEKKWGSPLLSFDDVSWLGSNYCKEFPIIEELTPKLPDYIRKVKYDPRIDPEAPCNRYKSWRCTSSTTRNPPEVQPPLFSYDVDEIEEVKLVSSEEKLKNLLRQKTQKTNLPYDILQKERRTMKNIMEKLKTKKKGEEEPEFKGLYEFTTLDVDKEDGTAKPVVEGLTRGKEKEAEEFHQFDARAGPTLLPEPEPIPEFTGPELDLKDTSENKGAEETVSAKSSYVTVASLPRIIKNKSEKQWNRDRRLIRKSSKRSIASLPTTLVSEITEHLTSAYSDSETISMKTAFGTKQTKAKEQTETRKKETKEIKVQKQPKAATLPEPEKTTPIKSKTIQKLEKGVKKKPLKKTSSRMDTSDEKILDTALSLFRFVSEDKIDVEELRNILTGKVINIYGHKITCGPDEASNQDAEVAAIETKKEDEIKMVEPDIFRAIIPMGQLNVSGMEVINGIRNAADEAAKYLEKIKIKLDNRDTFLKVVRVFSNGDTWCEDQIADAFKKYGGKTEFFICKGKTSEDQFYVRNGYILRPGYKSPSILDFTDGARYNRPVILIINAAISDFNTIKPLVEDLKQTDRVLILIVKSITLNLIRIINNQNLRELPRNNKIITICYPNYFRENKLLVEDFGLFLGARVCELSDLQPRNWDKTIFFGSAVDVIVTKEEVCFLITKGRVKILKSIAASYRESMKTIVSKKERHHLKKRMQLLLGKICVIEAGRQWKDPLSRIAFLKEVIEKMELSYKYGVVVGSGNALIKSTDYSKLPSIKENERFGYSLFQQQVMHHICKYVQSPGYSVIEIVEKVRNLPPTCGFDHKTKNYCDLLQSGLIEPLMAVKAELFQIYNNTLSIVTVKSKGLQEQFN